MILAACAGEEAVVADAVEPARQGVEKKAADELVGPKGHDLLPSGTGLAVVLVAEGDPGFVEPEEAAVRYRNAVGVAREVSEHGLGPGERGDRKRVAWGKRVSVRVDLGCRRIIQNNTTHHTHPL